MTEVTATDAAPAYELQTAKKMTLGQIAFAVARRRACRKEEWRTQTRAAELLRRHLPAGAFVTALENAPRTALSGLLQKQRGTRAGLPDLLVIWRSTIIFIELKSRRGIASKVQRQVHDELLTAGVKWWWLARTPRACLVALHRSGVPLIRWRPPKTTEEWEGPFENPHARLPSHPVVAAERAAARKRCRERKRAREAAEMAAQRRSETDFPASTRSNTESPGKPSSTTASAVRAGRSATV